MFSDVFGDVSVANNWKKGASALQNVEKKETLKNVFFGLLHFGNIGRMLFDWIYINSEICNLKIFTKMSQKEQTDLHGCICI